MNKAKITRLKAAGWTVGSAAEFLDLSPEERALIELKLSLSESLKKRRKKQGLSQHALARRLHSSQSRIAKMESSDPTVSLDLLIRALLATGASRREVAKAIASQKTRLPLNPLEPLVADKPRSTRVEGADIVVRRTRFARQ